MVLPSGEGDRGGGGGSRWWWSSEVERGARRGVLVMIGWYERDEKVPIYILV